ncbi:unnamed protein product [Pelagomonas calceolata]|uniref:Uncharacterized protein n=1 Tax=Pelagomonas calceolata TaxID=35677 RepID=A0A8J2SKT0_9STRA|nr:unnamed protein product [Pelagomonas calceolata]
MVSYTADSPVTLFNRKSMLIEASFSSIAFAMSCRSLLVSSLHDRSKDSRSKLPSAKMCISIIVVCLASKFPERFR